MNNFLFEEQEVKIDGTSHKVFSVQKRRGGKKRLADQSEFAYGGKNVHGNRRSIDVAPNFAGLIGTANIDERE